jgi:adenylate cyclase class IV
MSAEFQLREIGRHWLRSAFRLFVRTSADHGHAEVERKFSCTEEEANLLSDRLETRGFRYAGTVAMNDTFLPAAIPGEMLRVRQEKLDENPAKVLLTFKQWMQTATGKERRETEREVLAAVAVVWLIIGRFVSGTSLLGFGKRRRLYDGQLNGKQCVVAIDKTSGLGRYSGWYVEIEVILPLDGDFPEFERCILDLADQLFTAHRDPLKRSYMDMLVETT